MTSLADGPEVTARRRGARFMAGSFGSGVTAGVVDLFSGANGFFFDLTVEGTAGRIFGARASFRRTSFRFGNSIAGTPFSGGVGFTFRTLLFCPCVERLSALLVNEASGVRKNELATSAKQTTTLMHRTSRPGKWQTLRIKGTP